LTSFFTEISLEFGNFLNIFLKLINSLLKLLLVLGAHVLEGEFASTSIDAVNIEEVVKIT